jgi:ABC-type amino acid transport substrate-binding protein
MHTQAADGTARSARALYRAAPAALAFLVSAALIVFAACSDDSPQSAPREVCVEPERTLTLGFYAFYAPVSSSVGADAEDPDFDRHSGYEADLLTALEAMQRTGLRFERRAIARWPDIWLLAAEPDYDIIGGGITILDARRRDSSGNEVIVFTSGHIAFRQSLLVRAQDAARLSSHDALTSSDRVGVLAGTTGEARLLELTGLADEDGVFTAGVRIRTSSGELTSDGTARYSIRSAQSIPQLSERRLIIPPDQGMPQVVYPAAGQGERELLEALTAGEIDAIARGEVGNREAADSAAGAFAVTALDPAVEWGGFALDAEDGDLADCVDLRIGYLTDERRIGYQEWLADPQVFMQRAERWNRER